MDVMGTMPTQVIWDERTPGGSSSDATLSIVRAVGELLIVTREGLDPEHPFCRPGPELLVPVQVSLDLDDGGAQATLEGTLASPETAPEALYVDAEGPIALSEDWEDVAEQDLLYRQHSLPAAWYLSLYQTEWSAPRVAIGADGNGYDATLWLGHFSFD